MTSNEQAKDRSLGRKALAMRVLRLLGVLITIASWIYVASALAQRWQMPVDANLAAIAGLIVFLSLFYIAALIFLSIAWYKLMIFSGCESIAIWQSVIIIGRTEVQKYIPTNVVHLVSRYFHAQKTGATVRQVGTSLIVETGLIVFVGLALALFGDVNHLTQLTHVPVFVWETVLVVCLLPLVFWQGTANIASRLALFRTMNWSARGRACVLLAIACYVAFFLVGGVAIYLLMLSLGQPEMNLGFFSTVSVAALAWIAGFIVLGSPGGLGVREGVLIFALTNSVGPMSTFVAIAYRLVTLGGELWFYLICTYADRLVQRRTA